MPEYIPEQHPEVAGFENYTIPASEGTIEQLVRRLDDTAREHEFPEYYGAIFIADGFVFDYNRLQDGDSPDGIIALLGVRHATRIPTVIDESGSRLLHLAPETTYRIQRDSTGRLTTERRVMVPPTIDQPYNKQRMGETAATGRMQATTAAHAALQGAQQSEQAEAFARENGLLGAASEGELQDILGHLAAPETP